MYVDFRAAEKSFVCASCSRRGKMHQQYSSEVAKVLSQLNSEDRKTATSKVQFQLQSLVKLCFSTLHPGPFIRDTSFFRLVLCPL